MVVAAAAATTATATARAVLSLSLSFFLPFGRKMCEAMGRTEVTATTAEVATAARLSRNGSLASARILAPREAMPRRSARESTNRSARLPPRYHGTARHSRDPSGEKRSRGRELRACTRASGWDQRRLRVSARGYSRFPLTLQAVPPSPWLPICEGNIGDVVSGRRGLKRASRFAHTGEKDSSRFAYRER